MEKGFGKKMDRSEMPRIVPQAKAGEFDAPGANDFQIVSGSHGYLLEVEPRFHTVRRVEKVEALEEIQYEATSLPAHSTC